MQTEGALAALERHRRRAHRRGEHAVRQIARLRVSLPQVNQPRRRRLASPRRRRHRRSRCHAGAGEWVVEPGVGVGLAVGPLGIRSEEASPRLQYVVHAVHLDVVR